MDNIPGIIAAVGEGREEDAEGLIADQLSADRPETALYKMAGFVSLMQRHPHLSIQQLAVLAQAADAELAAEAEAEESAEVTEAEVDEPTDPPNLLGEWLVDLAVELLEKQEDQPISETARERLNEVGEWCRREDGAAETVAVQACRIAAGLAGSLTFHVHLAGTQKVDPDWAQSNAVDATRAGLRGEQIPSPYPPRDQRGTDSGSEVTNS